MPAAQALPSSQACPDVQHGLSGKPHWAHSLVVDPATMVQTVSESVQSWPGQHGLSIVPHSSQKPFAPEHTCCSSATIAHVPPGAMHVAFVASSSQQPPVHWLPRQHASPAAPQGWHDVP
jgi:hypothetical protein